MADPRSRARVERIIAGDFRPDDLTHLFLYARDRCDGRESVREVGDFVAHHAERTKGIITRSTREWFAIANYMAWNFGKNRNVDGTPKPLDARNFPAIFPDYLRATLHRIEPKKLPLGRSRLRTLPLLEKVIGKFKKNNIGGYYLSEPLEQNEQELVQVLASVIVVKSAFSGDRLYDDFIATLRSNGLISSSEVRATPTLKTVIPLFALAVMHNCAVVMDDGSRVVLKAGPFDQNNGLSVLATIHPPEPPPFAAAIYESGLDATTFCELELLGMESWDVEIELKPSGKLGVM